MKEDERHEMGGNDFNHARSTRQMAMMGEAKDPDVQQQQQDVSSMAGKKSHSLKFFPAQLVEQNGVLPELGRRNSSAEIYRLLKQTYGGQGKPEMEPLNLLKLRESMKRQIMVQLPSEISTTLQMCDSYTCGLALDMIFVHEEEEKHSG